MSRIIIKRNVSSSNEMIKKEKKKKRKVFAAMKDSVKFHTVCLN